MLIHGILTINGVKTKVVIQTDSLANAAVYYVCREQSFGNSGQLSLRWESLKDEVVSYQFTPALN